MIDASGSAPDPRPLVIFHDHCADGFTAAWVAWRWYSQRGIDVELLAARYGDAPPIESARGRDVLIVDFSYPRAGLLAMHDVARELLVLDHHRTAQADLEGLPFARFDMERSGAAMAWDHFFPPTATRPNRPWIVDYVEDRDLWRWALSCSREVSAGLAARDFDLATWSRLADQAPEAQRMSIADEGAAILRYQARVVRSHVERARMQSIRVSPDEQMAVPTVNATSLQSEIGNELARLWPFAVVWFETADGSIVYSLRSCAENPEHVDVSVIAKLHGGGGHKHAAGFTHTVSTLQGVKR